MLLIKGFLFRPLSEIPWWNEVRLAASAPFVLLNHRRSCSHENEKAWLVCFCVFVFDSSVFAEHSFMFSLDLFPVSATCYAAQYGRLCRSASFIASVLICKHCITQHCICRNCDPTQNYWRLSVAYFLFLLKAEKYYIQKHFHMTCLNRFLELGNLWSLSYVVFLLYHKDHVRHNLLGCTGILANWLLVIFF